MLASSEELIRIKRNLENRKEEAQRAKGRLEELTKRLNDMGYATIDDAEKALKQMQEEMVKMEAKMNEIVETIKKDFPQLWT